MAQCRRDNVKTTEKGRNIYLSNPTYNTSNSTKKIYVGDCLVYPCLVYVVFGITCHSSNKVP